MAAYSVLRGESYQRLIFRSLSMYVQREALEKLYISFLLDLPSVK